MSAKRKPLTYAQAGVDIARGDAVVEHLKDIVPGIGGFGGLYPLPKGKWRSPVLVASTDGVGTKLLVADAMNKHDTVGIDCVAMVVNDIVVCGAAPIFFLDYIGIGRLVLSQARQLLKGMAEGCEQAGCPLLGGETAELPGIYPEGQYDLAGFGVGIVEKSKILDPKSTRPGDKVIGLASSGLHSNGFSLARKIAFERAGLKARDRVPELGGSIGQALLAPTRIYVKTILALLRRHEIRSIAHITGGGLPFNLNRALAPDCDAVIYTDRWERPAIFRWLAENGPVEEAEMYKTFNMGIGMALVVPAKAVPGVLRALKRMGETAFEIGEVVEGERKVRMA
ncbi:MAG: Phosphoribosylformylglycinamidine cyclo-ligase [candidate division BRC1 bacterium ADurb.BinA364]|nr:MAG: Phosphoribosylformylglycinamidine cyclo-ligase [candidate division BRC1 bacterium ADurb.BinA364]